MDKTLKPEKEAYKQLLKKSEERFAALAAQITALGDTQVHAFTANTLAQSADNMRKLIEYTLRDYEKPKKPKAGKEEKYTRRIMAGDKFNLVEQQDATVISIVPHKNVASDIFVHGDNQPDTEVVVFCYNDCNKRLRYSAMPIGSFLYSVVLRWENDNNKAFGKEARKKFFNKNGLSYE